MYPFILFCSCVHPSICPSLHLYISLSYPLISPSILPIHPNTQLLSSIYPSVHPTVSSILLSIHILTHLISALICASTQKLMGLSIYQPISCPSTHPRAYPLNYLLLHSPVCPLTRPYIPYLSVHLCTHLSINPSIPLIYTLAYETLTGPSSHLHLLTSPLDWASGAVLKKQKRRKWMQVSKIQVRVGDRYLDKRGSPNVTNTVI